MMVVLTETPLADMSLWSLALETIVLHPGTSRTSSQSLISKCETMLILEFPLEVVYPVGAPAPGM